MRREVRVRASCVYGKSKEWSREIRREAKDFLDLRSFTWVKRAECFPNIPDKTNLEWQKSFLERFLRCWASFEKYFELSNAKLTFPIAFENVVWKYSAPQRWKNSETKRRNVGESNFLPVWAD